MKKLFLNTISQQNITNLSRQEAKEIMGGYKEPIDWECPFDCLEYPRNPDGSHPISWCENLPC